MNVTRKLRKWVEDNRTRLYMGGLYPYEVGAIADEIDAEHKRLTDKAHADVERSAMKQVRSKSMDYKKGCEQAMKDVDERTKTEHDGVITDELREWKANIQTRILPEDVLRLRCELNNIADRIDRQCWRECDKAYNNGVCDGIDADKNAMGYVKLPVDANGVPIHVGDVMEGRKIGGGFGEPFDVVGYIMSNGELEPMDEHKCQRKHVYLRHHQPTVEDVLREIVHKCEPAYSADGSYTTGLTEEEFAEYAAKLRLAGESK